MPPDLAAIAQDAVLRFTPHAWAKLLYMRDAGTTEVGGFGVVSSSDLLLIEDFITVKQTATTASINFDDEAVADFFDQQVDVGHRPEQFARCWIHTHPGNSPDPSSVDEETFARVFGGSDFAMIMMILAEGGKAYARLRFNVGPGGDVLIPVTVDYSSSFAASDTAAWELEYRANIDVRQVFAAFYGRGADGFGGVAYCIVVNAGGLSLTGSEVDEKTALSILRSRPMMFLVTRQIRTQIVIDHSESNWIGQWRGVLWGTVTISYGVDVNEIKVNDLRREGGVVFVRIPEPRLLSFAVEPGSIGFMSKATVAPKLQDWLDGGGHRRQLESRLHDQAMAFARKHDVLPSRAQIVDQLNDTATGLADAAGIRIRFE